MKEALTYTCIFISSVAEIFLFAVKKLRAAFAYEALNEDELTLAVDDILDFIAVEEEGWWRGRLNGKEGVFPSNFVEEKTTSSSQELPPRPEKPAMTHSDRPAPPIPTQPVERTSQQAEPAPPIPNRLEEAPPLFPEKALVDKVDGANGEPIKKGMCIYWFSFFCEGSVNS